MTYTSRSNYASRITPLLIPSTHPPYTHALYSCPTHSSPSRCACHHISSDLSLVTITVVIIIIPLVFIHFTCNINDAMAMIMSLLRCKCYYLPLSNYYFALVFHPSFSDLEYIAEDTDEGDSPVPPSQAFARGQRLGLASGQEPEPGQGIAPGQGLGVDHSQDPTVCLSISHTTSTPSTAPVSFVTPAPSFTLGQWEPLVAPPPGGVSTLASAGGTWEYRGKHYPHLNPQHSSTTTAPALSLPLPTTTTATVVPPQKVSRLRKELELWWEEDHR